MPAEKIVEAARLFAHGPTMSFWTMGLNQRITGVWANNLMHNLHLLTGQIGKPGATPFSLTGQPNACGGVRDTGTLCHILPYGRVGGERRAPRRDGEALGLRSRARFRPTPGLNTIEMFKALGREQDQGDADPDHEPRPLAAERDALSRRDGQGAAGQAVRRRDRRLSDAHDRTGRRRAAGGDVVREGGRVRHVRAPLPAAAQDRRRRLGEARSDFDILLDLAARLEKAGVVPRATSPAKFTTPDDVWDEMREASRGHGLRLHRHDPRAADEGTRHPLALPRREDHPGTARRFVKGDDPLLDAGPYADNSLEPGEISFYGAPDKRAIVWLRPAKPAGRAGRRRVPVCAVDRSRARALAHRHDDDEGRRAAARPPGAFVEIHPDDAKQLGIKSGDRVRITSRRGEAVDQGARGRHAAAGHGVRALALGRRWTSLINRVTIDAYDPGSKQPEFKICAVKLAKV